MQSSKKNADVNPIKISSPDSFTCSLWKKYINIKKLLVR